MHFIYLAKTISCLFACVAFTAILSVEAANATIYYVAKTGSDSNPGTNTQPLRTIKKGLQSISAGDTLYVKSGTYSESLRTTGGLFIPNGTSWNNPITVAANPGDTVTIKPLQDNAGFWILDGQSKYLIIKNFIIDGATIAKHGFKFEGGTKYVRVINCEIKNTKGSAIMVTGSGNTYHEFINVDVHHNGLTQFQHGAYFETGQNVIEKSAIHHNAGYGVHVYKSGSTNTASNNIIRNSKLHDNNTYGASGCGLLFSSGTGNVGYNNIAYGNFHGFCMGYGAKNTRLYNNISYENDLNGIQVTLSSTDGSRVENNTVYKNGTYGIYVGYGATNTTVRNNISRSNAANFGLTATTSSNNLQADPQFVNAAAKDFHLQAGSPAMDTGTTISGITIDHDGNARPQGSSFDIGAYEFQTGSETSGGGSGGGGSGGGGTFPPPISAPAPGATLTSTSVTFTGGHTSEDGVHALWVGTTVGSSNLHSGDMANHSQTVSGLPTSGTLYVRYWSTNSSGGWVFQDHTYTMAVGSGGGSGGGGSGGGGSGGGGTFPPPISAPAPGATLTSTSVTFTGGHTSEDGVHALWVGTTVGSSNLHSGAMANHSQTVSGLPTSGTLYVRYWSTNSSGGWVFQDHTYTMAVGSGGGSGGGGTFPPPISAPAPGATLTSTSVTFTGGHTSEDGVHALWVGTTVGSSNRHAGAMANHSQTVSGLPTSGTLYVRYWSTNSSGGWVFQDHTYTMAVGGN